MRGQPPMQSSFFSHPGQALRILLQKRSKGYSSKYWGDLNAIIVCHISFGIAVMK